MFRPLYKAIFRLQLQKVFFDIQLAMCLKYEISCALECEIQLYRVIKKSLYTWWLQYRKLEVMFKVSPASLQTFIDARLTLTPPVIPNYNYIFMVSDWNCLKYFCVFFCTVIIRCTETFWSPCIITLVNRNMYMGRAGRPIQYKFVAFNFHWGLAVEGTGNGAQTVVGSRRITEVQRRSFARRRAASCGEGTSAMCHGLDFVTLTGRWSGCDQTPAYVTVTVGRASRPVLPLC
jgi:hypothetical protein